MNDHELLGLVYFLQQFRCYLEGTKFEVITDNQVLKNFFTKTELSRREARWLDFLSQFGITSVTLKKGRVHVLGDTLSRIPQDPLDRDVNINNIHQVSVEIPSEYQSPLLQDKIFGPIWKALQGNPPRDKILREKVNRLIDQF